MLTRNLTNAIIVLPSRYKLHPGDNEVDPSVLKNRKNIGFLQIQEQRGKLALGEQEPNPPEKGRHFGPAVERFHTYSGQMTRLDLCKLSDSQVLTMALKMDIETANLIADEVRVLIAEELFE